jgi:hypothetical protein
MVKTEPCSEFGRHRNRTRPALMATSSARRCRSHTSRAASGTKGEPRGIHYSEPPGRTPSGIRRRIPEKPASKLKIYSIKNLLNHLVFHFFKRKFRNFLLDSWKSHPDGNGFRRRTRVAKRNATARKSRGNQGSVTRGTEGGNFGHYQRRKLIGWAKFAQLPGVDAGTGRAQI